MPPSLLSTVPDLLLWGKEEDVILPDLTATLQPLSVCLWEHLRGAGFSHTATSSGKASRATLTLVDLLRILRWLRW